MTGTPWFKQKRYGYGVTPVGWPGWTFLAAIIAAIAILIFMLLPQHWVLYIVSVVLLSAVLIIVSIAKSQGEWRWRWGQRN